MYAVHKASETPFLGTWELYVQSLSHVATLQVMMYFMNVLNWQVTNGNAP